MSLASQALRNASSGARKTRAAVPDLNGEPNAVYWKMAFQADLVSSCLGGEYFLSAAVGLDEAPPKNEMVQAIL